MTERARPLWGRLRAAGQEHVLAFLDGLRAPEAERFLAQLEALDLDRIARLVTDVLSGPPKRGPLKLDPPDLIDWGTTPEHRARDAAARQAGEEALRAGRVGAFLVAGGQGTRLGFDGPKGRFPIGPVTGRSLFAYHAQRVLAVSRRYDASLPLYVMTSEVNRESTQAAFAEAGWFGLHPDQVFFLVQGMLPAVDANGRLLLATKASLCMSPDGHGGCLRAMARSGALEDMERRGVADLFYFQVDNPLALVFDPVFIGHHLLAEAEMSTKVVAKTDPNERVGVLGLVDGRPGVIEYSDLPPDLARARSRDGALRFRAGNIAIHMLGVGFVRRLLEEGVELPVHRANKKVACLDSAGRPVIPAEPNAIKMEMFVFDGLPLARRTVTQEVLREEEFAPVKNAEGADSPATARAALSAQARRWAAAAGLEPPPGDAEVGPLFALDADEFARNLTARDVGPVFDRS